MAQHLSGPARLDALLHEINGLAEAVVARIAAPEDRHARARSDARGVRDRAHARGHGAADERRHIERLDQVFAGFAS